MSTDLPLPPDELNFVGAGDFDANGRQFLWFFEHLAGLKPHHRVLDVGCGIGRMARPLTGYLDASGSYEGFDIVDVGIDWCRANITPRFPNFKFQRADVYNPAYHPGGRYDAAEYAFPFPSESFDFVCLTSVFTHMRPAGVENYTREISRVLKVGGRCLITYFLQTDETAALGRAGRGRVNFVHRRDGYWIARPEVADEEAIAFDEADVLALYERCGLAVAGPIRRGAWSGRADFLTLQDLVVAEKVRSVAFAPPRQRPPARGVRAWAETVGRWCRVALAPRSQALKFVRRARRHAA